MSEAKHTPGPWAYVATDPSEGWNGFRITAEVVTPERAAWGDIGTVTGPQDNPSSLADARLIAAAPEMLEALQYLSELYDKLWFDMSTVTTGEQQAMKRAWDIADAAIAKATGK